MKNETQSQRFTDDRSLISSYIKKKHGHHEDTAENRNERHINLMSRIGGWILSKIAKHSKSVSSVLSLKKEKDTTTEKERYVIPRTQDEWRNLGRGLAQNCNPFFIGIGFAMAITIFALAITNAYMNLRVKDIENKYAQFINENISSGNTEALLSAAENLQEISNL